ncbi:MAG TPA: hypothetical protein VMF12_19705 [Xanthobacteraceae bacterium]|nr:hypothetical protein [Xanthobacteraceae bacterium]
MISKSTVAAMVLGTMSLVTMSLVTISLVTISLASPASAQVYYDQVPVVGYYGYVSPYDQPGPYGGPLFGFGYWNPNNPHSIDNNIHTPPNH